MTNRNPYENEDTVDIPDFPSIKADDEDIDLSAFNLNDDEDNDDEYEEYDDEPKYRKVKSPVIVITVVLLVLLLGLSIFGIVRSSSLKNKYETLQAEYDAYKTTATNNERALNEKVAVLEAQVKELTEGPVVKEGEKATYTITADSINVRDNAGSSTFASYNSLSDEVKKVCYNADGSVLVYKGSDVDILETKDVDGSTWGKIDSNAWICIKLAGQDPWATIKK